MEYQIATIKDVEDCFKLARQENEDYWNKNDFFNLISNSNGIFIVAKEDNKVLGFITGFIVPTKENEAMIHETRTDVTIRGRGVGSKLVDTFCKVAKDKGIKIVYAMIEKEVMKFYIDSCKFKVSGNWIEISKKL